MISELPDGILMHLMSFMDTRLLFKFVFCLNDGKSVPRLVASARRILRNLCLEFCLVEITLVPYLVLTL